MAGNSIAQSGVERNPRPLEKTEMIWTDDYLGTKDQLIAAGLAKEGQFPGDPGGNKVMASFDEYGSPLRRQPRGGYVAGSIHIQRASRGRFCVSVTLPEDEGKRRSAAAHVEREARLERKKAEESAKTDVRLMESLLDLMPKTHEAFLKAAVDDLSQLINGYFTTYMVDGANRGGFCFSRETHDEFYEAATDLLTLVERGSSFYDPIARTRRLIEARAKVARLDAPFQRFLQSVSSDSSSLHN